MTVAIPLLDGAGAPGGRSPQTPPPAGVGPHYVFGVRVSRTRLSSAWGQGLQTLPAVWLRSPHPLLTPSGLPMLVLNPWDQRPQTVATVSGTSRSERWSPQGEGCTPGKRARSSRLDSAPSGRRARWPKQPHAEWRLDQSVTSGEERGGGRDHGLNPKFFGRGVKLLGVTGTLANCGEENEFWGPATHGVIPKDSACFFKAFKNKGYVINFPISVT